jgi:hypothetical protein
LTLEEANGEFFVVIPPEAATACDFKLGDTIYWHANADGSFSLTKDPTR